MSNLAIGVLGPGAVGGFVAAMLARKGASVTCIAREKPAKIISHKGIRINSVIFGKFTAKPKAVTRLDHELDFLFITTKATTLKEALDRVDPRLTTKTVIIPLLNGAEHVEILRTRYGKKIAAGNISIEVIKESTGKIIHKTPFARVKLGSDGDVPVNRLNEISKLLSDAGIETKILKNVAEVIWEKLVRLNALACTTSASGWALGRIRSDPQWHKQLEGCVREGAAVATAEGVKTDPETVMNQIESLPASLTTSMQRDILAGNPSELDAIAGAVIRVGSRHGIDCPTISGLVEMIKSHIANNA